MINFAYEINNEKYLVWNYKNKKIKNKIFYFQNLNKLEYSHEIKLFLKDTNFNYYYNNFYFNQDKKFNLLQLEKLLSSFCINKNEKIIWYYINNIIINWQKEKFILWKKWEISFWIWLYTLHKKYLDKIKWIFWQNKVKIYPSSISSIQCISNFFESWNLIYLLENNTKIIKLEKWFYKKIEEIEVGLKSLSNSIAEIFHTDICFEELNEFQKSVYLKKINEFIQPISIFIKKNISNKTLYLISDLKKYPKLIDRLSDNLNIWIIPLKIDNKSFKTIEQLDLFCIEKTNV